MFSKGVERPTTSAGSAADTVKSGQELRQPQQRQLAGTSSQIISTNIKCPGAIKLVEIESHEPRRLRRRRKWTESTAIITRMKADYDDADGTSGGIGRCRLPNPTTTTIFFRFIFSCTLLINHVHGCMPGYEGERARLRQYLGIEWSPGGLARMDAQQPKTMRHAAELNCDFSNPDQCKWRNVRGMDSLDFFLFRKEDNTEFPVLQVRPGPSKIPVGDQLLLTGDRKREEQSALLVSHPIKCQNTTGRLTFTFWLYNGARVEVLILDERDEGLNFLPEKPKIDCGTVEMNTECTVPIPARGQPFRIGIRAYDMRNTEGSFVMLDNILYEAQFCRVAIDFGANFRTESMLTGANGQLIHFGSELNCKDFDGTCRWRNIGLGENGIWSRAVGVAPSEMMLFNETGTYEQPILPVAFLYVEEGAGQAAIAQPPNSVLADASTSVNQFRMFASDPINCLGSSTITIRFRVWLTKGVQLSVCLLDPQTMRPVAGETLSCQPVTGARLPPALAQHSFQAPDNIEFMFAFRMDAVNIDFDNFVMLDDIELAGGIGNCGLSSTLGLNGDPTRGNNWLTDGTLLSTQMLSSLLNRAVHSAKELACDFSKRALNCQWANLERLSESMSPWEIGIGGAVAQRRQQQNNNGVGVKQLPESDVALARLDSPNDTAVLLSERIQCILDGDGQPGTLSFRSWHTGSVKLEVCIVRAHSLEVLDCQVALDSSEASQRGDSQVIVDIPRLDEPVRFALKAEAVTPNNAGGGVIALDDILFNGRICTSNIVAFAGKSGYGRTKGGDTSAGGRTTAHSGNDGGPQNEATFHAIPDENVCRLLSCSFEHDGSMCLYSSARVASSVSMFRAYNRTAFAMLFTRSRVAMLESPLFHLNAPARLHFDFIILKGSANLHICQDSVMRELDSCYPVFTGAQTMNWQHDFIEVLPTDRKLYLIAKLAEGERKASVQLDNLELTDVHDHRVC